MVTKQKNKDASEEAILTFLQLTKEGKYAEIDPNSLTYTRIEIEREEVYSEAEEEYFYSVM
jgi:hypothetical protein